MAIARSQDRFSFVIPSLRTLFADIAEQRRCAEEQKYREKLSPFEQGMFDAFQHLREQNLAHKVFAAVAGSSVRKVADHFTTYFDDAEARRAIESMAKDKYGPRVFIALKLQENFIGQWVDKPSGIEFDYKRSPVKAPGLDFCLATPKEYAGYQQKNFG